VRLLDGARGAALEGAFMESRGRSRSPLRGRPAIAVAPPPGQAGARVTVATRLAALAAALCLTTPWPGAAEERGRCEGAREGSILTVELSSDQGALLLFGARHRTDPADPFLAELERQVEAFAPTVILFEGDRPPVGATRQEAVVGGGEMGLLCWLAARRRIPCQGADLPEAEEARQLLAHHPPDEVLLFMTVRLLAYFNPRPAAQRPAGDLVAWALPRLAPLVGLREAEAGEALRRAWERELHRPFAPEAVTTAWHDPRYDDLPTQRMFRESNGLREPYMLERLLSASRGGARVFAALGEGHVCDLRPGLRQRWRERPGAGEGAR